MNDRMSLYLCVDALAGWPAATRSPESDHPAGGGGAVDHPEPDVVAAAADPVSRQTNTQSKGQKHTHTHTLNILEFHEKHLF